jgi:S-adenosylmethionine synthetase
MYYLTSESVTPWHPDKLCDRISDAVLDACLAQDPFSRVACECFATTGLLIIGGEISTTAIVDIEAIAREEVIAIGYNHPDTYFDGHTCGVLNLVHRQSPDIALGVDTGGAGDQGIMFGYASNETDVYMPTTIYYAHRLAERLTFVRNENILDYLLPDGKTQVTIKVDDDARISIDTVVLSTQHKPSVSQEQLKQDIITHVIKPVLQDHRHDAITLHINPTWLFTIGGPVGDAGLTGRKIIIDTYGGIGRHGGGAFSGKDPTKVDRSAAYMARYLAKNIVAAWLCDRCEIQLSYAIGVAQPLSLFVETFGTATVDSQRIVDAIRSHFDLSPWGIITRLGLRTVQYKDTTAFWHFGRDGFSREALDSVGVFASLL